MWKCKVKQLYEMDCENLSDWKLSILLCTMQEEDTEH
jgi:hypothetical protein